jgi:uncharacterized membrane protein (DUF485 family)
VPFADHGPTLNDDEAGRRPPPQAHIRLALLLFAVYFTLYGVFVLLNAFASQVMERTFAGINLAVWYGFALIIAAFALALVYGYLCRSSAAITARERR